MGMAYYSVLNPPIEGYQPELIVGGKAIARAMALLDAWAGELGVQPLSGYHSENLEETFEKIGEPVPEGVPDRPIKWSDPADGLATIRALVARIEAEDESEFEIEGPVRRNQTVNADWLAEDLRALEAVLKRASENKSKFRLRVDI